MLFAMLFTMLLAMLFAMLLAMLLAMLFAMLVAMQFAMLLAMLFARTLRCYSCRGMYYPVCGMAHIKDPQLLTEKRANRSSDSSLKGVHIVSWNELYIFFRFC